MPNRIARALVLALLLGGAEGCEPAAAAPEPATPAADATASTVPSIPKPGQAAPEDVVRAAAKACVAKGTAPAARSRMLAWLSSIASPAGEPCYLRALQEYQPGDQASEADLRAASKAVAVLELVSARGPLFEAFAKHHASDFVKDGEVALAMVAVADPAWEPKLVAYLERPVDPRNDAAVTDEVFWQLTAIESLGKLRSAAAARPLLRVLLTPAKQKWSSNAMLALTRIGAPALEAATKLLRKQDAELAAFGAAEAKAAGDPPGTRTPVELATFVLASIGRAESIGPVLEALATADPAERPGLACVLSQLPTDPRSLPAFRRTLETMPPDVKLPAARDARARLARCAPDFFDPSVVPWLADDARRLKGSDDLVQAVREAEFVAMLKVARPDQKKHLDEVARLGARIYTLGDEFKTAYTTVTGLLVACGEGVDCWLDRLTDPAAQPSEKELRWLEKLVMSPAQLSAKQFQLIKAAYMSAELGGAGAKQKLLAALPKLTDPMAVFVVVKAIDRLSPHGDPAAVAALVTMFEVAADDQERRQVLQPLMPVVRRLQARAP